jgi:hypothetical protein
MLDYLARLFHHATLEFAKQWLHDWGNLLLTAVIAVAVFMQGIFVRRLYKLQNSIEQSRLQPLLFCRITGDGTGEDLTTLEAQLWNLSQYGIWVERLEVVFSGPVATPLMTFTIEKILQSSNVEAVRFESTPFTAIVPLGPDMPIGPLTFKVQAKFYYSTASILGVWVSPFYEATLLGIVIRRLRKTDS